MGDIHELVNQLSLEDPNRKNDVVIAIDFGTSRTGVTWGMKEEVSNDLLLVEPLESDSILNNDDKKTPTIILLDYLTKKVKAFGQTAYSEYAEDKTLKDYLFKYFKMELHEQNRYDPHVRAANGKSIRLSKLLKECFEYIKDKILKIIKMHGVINNINMNDIVWIITVPAIWSDVAKSIMRKAAYEAGLIPSEKSFKLILAYEPECAFIGSIPYLKSKLEFKKDKKYLVVDCGGGTIDITCHQLESTKPVSINEVIKPTGGYLGSTLIDKLAFKFFKEFFGKDNYEDLEYSVSFVELCKSWEEVKLGFQFNSELERFSKINISGILYELEIKNFKELIEEWNVNHPDKTVRKVGSSNLGLSYKLMESFFEKPIQDVVDKVKEVVDTEYALRDLNYIILAGGFCKNIELQRKMIKEFKKERGIQVIIPRELDLLIVKGAAVFGSAPNDIVKIRKAKYTFGVHCTPEFDPEDENHLKYEHKKYLSRSGSYILLDVFDIYGRINDDIKVNEGKVGYLAPLEYDQKSIGVKVYISTKRDPFHISEEGNKHLGSAYVSLDMSVPYSRRGVKIEFNFGGTEVTCCIYSKTNGEFLDRIFLKYEDFFR